MNSLLPEERRHKIVEIINSEGKVTVPNLANRLGSSVDTIRRDLKELELAGKLKRVHGGALPSSHVVADYRSRKDIARPAKLAIALEAAKLIQPNQVVIFDGGTTSLEVARNLPIDIRLTIVTTSPPLVNAISHYPFIETIMIGGVLDTESMTVVGSRASEALSDIKADVCILGICSLNADHGVTTIGYEESVIKKLMVENSAEVIAVATTEKLGTIAPYKVSSIDHLTHIVTESDATDEQTREFIEAGIEVIKSKNNTVLNLNFR